jgi:hypothetical protein
LEFPSAAICQNNPGQSTGLIEKQGKIMKIFAAAVIIAVTLFGTAAAAAVP